MRLCICIVVGIALLLSVAGVAQTPAVNYQLMRKIPVAGTGGWDYLTLDGATGRLYVARVNRVQVIDVKKGIVIGEVANTPGVHSIALVSKVGRGYASAGLDDSVVAFPLVPVVDAKSGRLIYKTKRIKAGTRPDAIVFVPSANRVFSMNGGSHDATVIDVTTEKPVGKVPLGGKTECAVVDDAKSTVYVNLQDTGEVVSFNAKTLKVKNRWKVAPGVKPTGLAIDTKNRRLFATCQNEMMVVLNADTGKVLATPKIAQGSDAAEFDPHLGLAFSSNGQGTLTIVKEEPKGTFSVLADVPTQESARTMELDPKTHNVYLPAATRQEGMMEAEPGSFVILVFGL